MFEPSESIFYELTILIQASIHAVVAFQGINLSWDHRSPALLHELIPKSLTIVTFVAHNTFYRQYTGDKLWGHLTIMNLAIGDLKMDI